MPYYGKITRIDNGVEGAWLIELHADGTPILACAAIPAETMPDVVPVWTIALPLSTDPEIVFTEDEACELALMKMRRCMAELQGRDAGSWDDG